MDVNVLPSQFGAPCRPVSAGERGIGASRHSSMCVTQGRTEIENFGWLQDTFAVHIQNALDSPQTVAMPKRRAETKPQVGLLS